MCTNIIAIVDDDLPSLQALDKVLREGGHTTLPVHVTEERTVSDIAKEVAGAHVVLLDEDLERPWNEMKRGELVRNALLKAGFEGRFISITDGPAPTWQSEDCPHFTSKSLIRSGAISPRKKLYDLIHNSLGEPVTPPHSSF